MTEIEKLRNEVKELREELNKLRNSFGISDDYEEGPQDIICNSLRVSKDSNVLVYIGDYGNRGKSGVFQLTCANGNRIQIQGLYYDKAIRMYANNSNELLFSIGGDTQNGNVTVYNTVTKATSILRTTEVAGIIETYDRDGDISMRMT